jgi:hypothetical protein
MIDRLGRILPFVDQVKVVFADLLQAEEVGADQIESG